MNFGYGRISSADQNEDRQFYGLLKYAEKENIFIDKISGKIWKREKLEELKSKVRKDDHVYFYELDRLGRTKSKILEEINFFKKKGIHIHFMNIETTMIDLTKFGELEKPILEMINNLLIEVLSTIAETDLIKNKKAQEEGIKQAKKKGKYKGRKPLKVPTNFPELYKLYKNKKITVEQFKNMCNFKSKQTLYNKIKEYENKTS